MCNASDVFFCAAKMRGWAQSNRCIVWMIPYVDVRVVWMSGAESYGKWAPGAATGCGGLVLLLTQIVFQVNYSTVCTLARRRSDPEMQGRRHCQAVDSLTGVAAVAKEGAVDDVKSRKLWQPCKAGPSGSAFTPGSEGDRSCQPGHDWILQGSGRAYAGLRLVGGCATCAHVVPVR